MRISDWSSDVCSSDLDVSQACSMACAAESLTAAPAQGSTVLPAGPAAPTLAPALSHNSCPTTGDPMSDSYFPRWKLADETVPGAIIAPDERLSWPKNVAMGAQHVVAMFGSMVLAPLIMGFDPNVAILMSGIGTLIFFLFVGGRVPSYLGSSFAFIGGVVAVTGYAGRSEEHTSELQSLMRISYAVFCLKKKK